MASDRFAADAEEERISSLEGAFNAALQHLQAVTDELRREATGQYGEPGPEAVVGIADELRTVADELDDLAVKYDDANAVFSEAATAVLSGM